jgi:hypothetical protein
MPDDIRSHHRFHLYAAVGEGAGADDPDALTDEEAAKTVTAYTWPDFTQVRIFPREGFERYATPFEHSYSTLLAGEGRGAIPIVDRGHPNLDEGEVCMYLGWFTSSDLDIPSDLVSDFQASQQARTAMDGLQLESEQLWKFQIIVSRQPVPGMNNAFLAPEISYLVLTTIDGTVMQFLGGNGAYYGDMSTIQPLDFLGPILVKLVAGLGAAVIEYLVEEETLAALGTSRLVGRISAEEMEIHLTRITGKRPELRALRAMRNFQGDKLLQETLTSLKGWGQLYGKAIEEKTAEEMLQVTTRTNLITMQPPGIRSELWINKELLSQTTAREFYEEVVHEFCADALGWSGTANETVLAFVGDEYNALNSAQAFLERAVMSSETIGQMMAALRVPEL